MSEVRGSVLAAFIAGFFSIAAVILGYWLTQRDTGNNSISTQTPVVVIVSTSTSPSETLANTPAFTATAAVPTATALPSKTPLPTETPKPTPGPTRTPTLPAAGTVLYEVQINNAFADWNLTAPWKLTNG